MHALIPAWSAGLVAMAAQPTLPPPPLLQLPGLPTLLQRLPSAAPDLHEARARVEAERAKVAPAGALPDPDLALGLTKAMAADVRIESMDGGMSVEGLTGMLPARKEVSLMAGQVLPWPGKRAARTALAESGVRRAEAELETRRLAVEGEILDTVLDLLTLRAQRSLLQEQDQQWVVAEDLAKTCCELGKGSTSDLLLAIQTRARLRQRLLALDAREANLGDALARHLGAPAEKALFAEGKLLALPLPSAPSAETLAADLLARNPQLRSVDADADGASRALDLAQKERRPDFRVTGGLMAEGGMTPGWKAEVAFSVPLFSRRKQDMVVAQRRAEQSLVTHGREGLSRLILQRARERARAWTLARATVDLVAKELLPAGEANIQSLLSRYESGKADFSAVLTALNAQLSDREAHLGAVTALHRLSLHQYRAGLEPPPNLELGGSAMASAPSAAPAPSPTSAGPRPAQAETPAAAPMKM